jgi:ATP-dependent DNA ligase
MQAKPVHSIGKNLQILPIEERKAKLEDLLKKPSGVIRYSVSFTKDVEELLSRTRRSGKRSGAWIKLKLHQEQESSSADTPNQTGLGSILVRCWRASMKRRD